MVFSISDSWARLALDRRIYGRLQIILHHTRAVN